jgi:hypothetical protein
MLQIIISNLFFGSLLLLCLIVLLGPIFVEIHKRMPALSLVSTKKLTLSFVGIGLLFVLVLFLTLLK